MLRAPTGERILSSFVKMMTSSEEVDKECSVCLERLDDDLTTLAILQCGHYLHYQCLRDWNLKTEVEICPTCKAKVEKISYNITSETKFTESKYPWSMSTFPRPTMTP